MKKITTIIMAFLLCILLVIPVSASEVVEISQETDAVVLADENHPARVVDDADLLSDTEESELMRVLDETSERLMFDLAVVTVNDTYGQDIISYTDDYYDYNGYGLGETFDGAMLLIDMGSREFYISTCGVGIEALGDYELSYISDQFLSDLSNGSYYDAFYTFATLSDSFVTSYQDGSTDVFGDDYYEYEDGYIDYEDGYYEDDYGYESDDSSVMVGLLTVLIISLILGFLFAGIPMSKMKRQMKPVMLKAQAHDYLKPGSQKITKSRDAFLYNTVTRVPKPKQNSNGHGGGSFGGGVHMGSSGRSHGGMGGRF